MGEERFQLAGECVICGERVQRDFYVQSEILVVKSWSHSDRWNGQYHAALVNDGVR